MRMAKIARAFGRTNPAASVLTWLALSAALTSTASAHAFQAAAQGMADISETHSFVVFAQTTPSLFVDDITGNPGTPVPVTIEVSQFPDAAKSVLSIRGLPEGFSFSSGFRTADVWLVPFSEASSLTLASPREYSGSLELEFQLLRSEGPNPGPRKVWVDLRPSAGKVGGLSAGPVSRQKRIAPDEEAALLKRADALMKANDIAAARLIFGRLARLGSLQGALRMAQTYDPAYLSDYATAGLRPDREKAKHWYGIAAEFGSSDASGRLLALQASNP